MGTCTHVYTHTVHVARTHAPVARTGTTSLVPAARRMDGDDDFTEQSRARFARQDARARWLEGADQRARDRASSRRRRQERADRAAWLDQFPLIPNHADYDAFFGALPGHPYFIRGDDEHGSANAWAHICITNPAVYPSEHRAEVNRRAALDRRQVLTNQRLRDAIESRRQAALARRLQNMGTSQPPVSPRPPAERSD